MTREHDDQGYRPSSMADSLAMPRFCCFEGKFAAFFWAILWILSCIVVVLGSINSGAGKVELRHKALLVTGVVAIQMSNVLLYGVKTDSARHILAGLIHIPVTVAVNAALLGLGAAHDVKDNVEYAVWRSVLIAMSATVSIPTWVACYRARTFLLGNTYQPI